MTDEPIEAAPVPAEEVTAPVVAQDTVDADAQAAAATAEREGRSAILAANEHDNAMRALYGPDYADKAAQ